MPVAIQLCQSQRQQLAVMECERWMNARIDALRMRSVFDQNDTSYKNLPQKLEKRFVNFDPSERNFRGETLIICVVRYVSDRALQVRYINLLIRNGCDPNEPDTRNLRTPLMLACIARNEAVSQHLIHLNVDLTAADKLGNTALMYAALYGHSGITSLLVNQLTRRWSFDVFRATNCMGYTAEALARKNGRYDCSLLLKRERLHMLQRMHRQLALINLSASLKGWSNYQTIYKAKQAFLNCRSKANGGGKPHGGGGMTFPRISRRNSAGYQDPTRLSRSIGEDDFQNLMQVPHLPPLKSRGGRTIGGSVEFPPIYADGFSH
ncbi:hypothetical protein QR680_017619 [Steinernema hermaphroditum]|uniref:ANK_REP_REGION domain-containing protein n=1 Tax=Steinernema hermaphroditum TaxID=289476 RepID=A0AA39HFW2_9BILA|nr:hypothetical protein QR680_017619 [Steinernema hermaphroditum]